MFLACILFGGAYTVAAVVNVLLAVMGRSPAILTEALYYYARRHKPPVRFSEIVVITTKAGRQDIHSGLLSPGRERGVLAQMLRRVGYGKGPRFPDRNLVVIRDAAGRPAEDIRDSRESIGAGDQIGAVVQRITARSNARLYAVLAGGRKTMAAYLMIAMQLYGRPGDRLLHVLVDPRVENDAAARERFFYPDGPLRTSSGAVLQPDEIAIDVDEMPLFFWPRGNDFPAVASLSELAALRQRELEIMNVDTRPDLTVDTAARTLAIGGRLLRLPRRFFFYYYYFAERRSRCHCETGCPLCLVRLDQLFQDTQLALSRAGDGRPFQAVLRQEIASLRRLYALYQFLHRGSSRTEACAAVNESFGRNPGNVAADLSKINGMVRRMISPAAVRHYGIFRDGNRGESRYGIRLEKAKLRVIDPFPYENEP